MLVVVGLAYSLLEISLIIWVSGQIGALWSLAIMIGTAVLGGWLMGVEWRRSATAYRKLRAEGKAPEGELLDVLLIMAGGLLLFLPGYVGDVLGLFVILPFTRPIVRRGASAVIDRWMRSRGVDVTRLRVASNPGTVIEGETVSDSDSPSTGPDTPMGSSEQSPDDPIVIRGEIEP